MIRKLLSYGLKAELLMLVFSVGVVVGMIVEAALIVAAMAGHALGADLVGAVFGA